MEDVFDLTGRPPRGWMHALFGAGPYGEDVGRCVPGPPAPESVPVPLPGGGEYVYLLVKVASWSDPEDPIAVYSATGPVPVPPLSALERSWLERRKGRRTPS
ncbi:MULTISPECIES: hypothetical protein [Streptomyces]|uniref:Uncharacterized protein n=1 Tax=Streptomyces spororaveus TaxID=284039 RepID=A0ABQ3TPW4_9ACTN|nr:MULTISPECIES: hypothetical protein [Streptomyces]MCX5308863.1 hypothetical protein [Streptomyces sp. NBC_00160]GHI82441.1 hypothetical protein Sspor_80020 [Streptomyces spororaveus]